MLNNDEREVIRFGAVGVFVDSEPTAYPATYELSRRQRAEIRFSDVGTAHLAERGYADGFVLAGNLQ